VVTSNCFICCVFWLLADAVRVSKPNLFVCFCRISVFKTAGVQVSSDTEGTS
jgi:hypothetical protein